VSGRTTDLVRWAREDRAAIAALSTPDDMRTLRAEILALDDDLNRELSAAVARASAQADPGAAFESEVPALGARVAARRSRYAQLGLRACAEAPR
jgi:hypothetical protein